MSSRETTPAGGADSTSAGEDLRTLDGAVQDEAALYGSLGWKWGRASLQGGSRLTWQRQRNGDRPQVEGAAWNGFLGLLLPIGTGFLANADIGSGLRFPSLSERFFTGTTGRGGVIGNPELESERSVNLDLGLRWHSGRHRVAGHVFHHRIERYIERVELEPDLFTFENLISGAISGLELEASHALGGGFELSSAGHLIEGRAGREKPLADIPADRVELALRRTRDRWRWDAAWEYRNEKEDAGPGEKTIPAAQLVSAALTYAWLPDLSVSLSGSNLFEEAYFSSADEKVPLAPGRSLGIGLRWGEPR